MSTAENLTAQWHEAKAADLLRALDDVPSERDVQRAAAHAEVARSIRTGELARAVLEGGRSNANALRRVAERLRR